MPHIIDKETGLCSICQRLQIAAIKEGKKYKRQAYDVRKLAIESITNKNDPNYKFIVDRHYVKYKDSFDHYNSIRKSSIKYGLRPTFTKKISFDNNLVNEKLENNSDFESRSNLGSRYSSSNNYRESLRKINLVQASRLNDKYDKKSNPFSINQQSNISRDSKISKSMSDDNNCDDNKNDDYFEMVKSQKKTNKKKKSLQGYEETKVFYLSDFENSSFSFDIDEIIQVAESYRSLPSIYKN